MKKLNKLIFWLLLLSIPFSQKVAASDLSAEAISEMIRAEATCDFGYVDNTEYYMQYYFHELSFVDDSCIVTCADSSNFNEFGVFHVSCERDVAKCEKVLKKYVEVA